MTALSNLTMSSHEIAALTGKRHDNVVADVRKMLSELVLGTPEFLGVYEAENGQQYECFNLPKRESLILISGYSIELRARIIDRWQELEAQQGPKLPATMAEALRLGSYRRCVTSGARYRAASSDVGNFWRAFQAGE